MNISYPQWTTEITDTTAVGEDQLGIEGAAQGYQQEILPGIITVTDHARYYSFYAWILYRYIFGKESNRLIQGFRGQFFKRHEMALILASFSHHNSGKTFRGVVGSNQVRTFWGKGDSVSLDQEYFQNKEGGFGQYYRTAMQAMGIIDEPENPNWVYPLTERGKALAEAYQASISLTKYLQKLETNGQLEQLTKTDLEEYGQAGCLCPGALISGHDKTLLLDTFFRMNETQDFNNPHVRRRNSLGVALDLVYQAGGKFRRDQLRPALYMGEYLPGVRYQPVEELMDWYHRWQMVEVRHIFTFGIQCLWATFLLELRSRVGIKRVDWHKWVLDQLNELGWNLSVPRLAEKLSIEAGLSDVFENLLNHYGRNMGMQSGVDEYTLYVKATRNQTNAAVLFQTGLRVLLQLYLRYYPAFKNQSPIWNELAEKPRIPLNTYFQSMNDGLQKPGWLVKEWLAWLYQDYIFEQHEMIALEKLRYQEYDTFKFYYEDGVFHWPTGKKFYQEPVRLAANRLNNCLTMLVDLGLVLENEQGLLCLSPEGEVYRTRVIEGLRNAN